MVSVSLQSVTGFSDPLLLIRTHRGPVLRLLEYLILAVLGAAHAL